ncbi:MAG: lipoprotein [Xanthobacteraceae bacterium]|uniref:LPS translocon maturation chaperone LptM n=1 Tax=Pseudolabrys sp. TaxID=1960880 RepID=UPI003D0F30BC
MTGTGHLTFRFALIVALAATLGLTACGRKGPLDPPPAATAGPAGAPSGGASADDADAPAATGEDPAAKSQAPNKRIPLDVLLN